MLESYVYSTRPIRQGFHSRYPPSTIFGIYKEGMWVLRWDMDKMFGFIENKGVSGRGGIYSELLIVLLQIQISKLVGTGIRSCETFSPKTTDTQKFAILIFFNVRRYPGLGIRDQISNFVRTGTFKLGPEPGPGLALMGLGPKFQIEWIPHSRAKLDQIFFCKI